MRIGTLTGTKLSLNLERNGAYSSNIFGLWRTRSSILKLADLPRWLHTVFSQVSQMSRRRSMREMKNLKISSSKNNMHSFKEFLQIEVMDSGLIIGTFRGHCKP